MARSQEYNGPKGAGNNDLTGHKVSWAYRTKSGPMGTKGEKSLEFKFK